MNTSNWNRVARISVGQAIFFQNRTGMRLARNISGMPMTANAACFMTTSKGLAPSATAVAMVAESTITSPKPVRISAVEAMRRNSLGTGANTRPSDTRAAKPVPPAASSPAPLVAGPGRAVGRERPVVVVATGTSVIRLFRRG